jgi:hypothetical protein
MASGGQERCALVQQTNSATCRSTEPSRSDHRSVACLRIGRTLAAQDVGDAEEIAESVQRVVRQRCERGEFRA